MIRTLATLLAVALFALVPRTGVAQERPNILFCIADDWGWPHAGAFGEPVVATPTFDRLAREGVLFERAFVSSPSCTPSRNAILTGQYHWRLEEGANLHSKLQAKFAVYPLLLEEAGYHVGRWRKSYGPGRLGADWAGAHPAGERYDGFEAFLAERPDDTPFCFWLGASDPHRSYRAGSGVESGMELGAVRVPAFFPDTETVRSDIADYFFEVQRFDSDVGKALALLEAAGELDRTVVVMTGDHGMPFPRCKSNLYEMGVRVPLAVRWGSREGAGRRVTELVSLTDIAPTFLEAAGLAVPDEMTGRSLVPFLRGEEPPWRRELVYGMERHTPAQAMPTMLGYPCRALRTDNWLFIRNFRSERWPAGVPQRSTRGRGFSDCDDGPTKQVILERHARGEDEPFYELCFDRRPGEELYDLSSDPDQLRNLADDEAHSEKRAELGERLQRALAESGDPRALEAEGDSASADVFDRYAYFGGLPPGPAHGRPNVLLILVDDMGFSDLGCYGSEIETPNIDRLAAGGLRFTQAYNTSKCFPSRACLLTGRYAQQVGMARRPAAMQNASTLGEVLGSTGYRTWMVGKHHGTENPFLRGFDRYWGMRDGASNHFNPGAQREGEATPAQKRANRAWCIDGLTLERYTPEPGFYSTDAYTRHALDYLDDYAGENRPFFLYLAYTAPHDPLHAWPEDIAKYEGRYDEGWPAVRERRIARQRELGLFPMDLPPSSAELDDWEALDDEARQVETRRMEVYAAMIDRVDQGVGQLIAKLEELEVLDDTLILFASDNGGSAESVNIGPGKIGEIDRWSSLERNWANVANAPLRKFKNYSYEGGICTPLIAHWPAGIEQTSRFVRTPVHFIDVMPTLIELAGGAQAASEPSPPLPGASWAPLLAGGEQLERDAPLMWSWSKGRAVRDGRWKLVTFGGDWELYDLEADRTERVDLAAEQPERVQRMAAAWEQWRASHASEK